MPSLVIEHLLGLFFFITDINTSSKYLGYQWVEILMSIIYINEHIIHLSTTDRQGLELYVFIKDSLIVYYVGRREVNMVDRWMSQAKARDLSV